MFRNFLKVIAGDPNKRDIQKYTRVGDAINELEPQFSRLSDGELREKTQEFRTRLAEALAGQEDPKERSAAEQAALDELLPEAFAAVREAAIRAIGQRHYDVQLIGGQVLHQGRIAEMRTGEGKTLVATLPSYLNALTGRGVHVITVNDYLARRDARWMGTIYQMLGLTVGVLQEAARTENGRKAFVVDFSRDAAQEDQYHLRLVDRREAYAADIVYGTNHEFGFDYLRDNMAMALEQRVQRERYFAIVDEVDNILIDEARTPLIISGPSEEDPSLYYQIARVVRQLKGEDFEIDERGRGIALTEIGEVHLEKLIGQPLRDPDRPEELSPEQARLLGHIEQAMRAEYLFKRNKDYLVEGGKVIIVDEFTGRKMIGRRWSDGLHQAVEAKESLQVQEDNVTYATITLQNYFRLYQKLAGMTGTALTEAEEFDRIYKLPVVAIPTNLEYQAARPDSSLVEVEFKEDGQKFHYFAQQADPERKPIFWRRKDYADVVFRTEEAKLRAITQDILRRHLLGQPLLVGTTSVELSERVSERLRPDPLQRLAQVLLIRQRWFEQNKREEDGMMVAELKPLDEKLDELSRSDMAKQMKELGLSSNPAGEDNIAQLTKVLAVPEESRPKLAAILQGGIRHNVLNAKKHDEESRIIADAGAAGAVTIATNMAGRGVDIKLGGELAEEVLTNVNRVLKKAGVAAPYDLSHEQREAELRRVPESEWGIYESECRLFLQMMDDAVRVKQVGGLHVIGSERHEARRIDNQLRGRAARQGDPGSSQFNLSLEDELMRRFGGQQVSDLMQRLKVDDSVPIQAGLVNRIIEQSQSRVEGYNFDVRKHLLEYDDVLNTQRNKIYEQRDRVFVKDDLTDDFMEMLEAEVKRRVDLALADEAEGGWKLMAWLEEAQPSIPLGPNSNMLYPSYLLEIFLRELEGQPQPAAALLDLAKTALETERVHLLQTVEAQVEAAQTRLINQTKEKRAEADMALEALENEAHENQQPVDGRAAYKSVGEALGINLQSSAADLRSFDLNQFKKQIPVLAETAVSARAQVGLIVAIERRIDAPLGLGNTLKDENWETIGQRLVAAAEKSHQARAERTLTEIERELHQALPAAPTRNDLCRALISMAWGTVTDYDRQHKKVKRMTLRLTYVFLAAKRIAGLGAQDLVEDIVDHLTKAYETLRRLIGETEAVRLANTKVAELPPAIQSSVRQLKGEGADLTTVGELGADAQPLLGQYVLTLIMRQNMLQVIGGLWVEYLTSVEALRTSIGLEAYAQRDPLVAYKAKAFEMFQELLVNMRAGVISRAFRISFQAPEPAAPPKRERIQAPADKSAAEKAPAPKPADAKPAATDSPARPVGAGEGGGRRHRKKR